MKTFNLSFQGYLPHSYRTTLPTCSGIYLVYRGYPTSPGEVSINELLYIGQAEDINARICNHEKLPEFESYLRNGEQIYYSYAQVHSSNLGRVENALIFTQTPPINQLLKDYFYYDATTVNVSGEALLVKDCTQYTNADTLIIINRM